MIKKIVSAVVAACLVASVSLALGADKAKGKGMGPMGEERGIIIIHGKVTAIKGNTVTVKDDAGKETTVSVKSARGLKEGDAISLEMQGSSWDWRRNK